MNIPPLQEILDRKNMCIAMFLTLNTVIGCIYQKGSKAFKKHMILPQDMDLKLIISRANSKMNL
jgi:hypothetical protein